MIRAKSKDGDGEGGVVGPVVQEDDSGGSTLVVYSCLSPRVEWSLRGA